MGNGGSCGSNKNEKGSRATVVLGAQFGDEGKGKVVDLLACESDVVCRFQGGSNAGHTVVLNEEKYDFHLLPSGVINDKCTSVMGNGMAIHLPTLFAEIEKNEKKGLQNIMDRLIISNRAHLVFGIHQTVDRLQEAEKGSHAIGTTKKGIGPAYASKASRTGLRVGDLIGDFDIFSRKYRDLVADFKKTFSGAPDLEFDIEAELNNYRDYAERIRKMVKDTSEFVYNECKDNKTVLIEGANAAMLDIDFGVYPYVTSSNCSIGGVCTGLGLPTTHIGHIYGVLKAYMTRVGDGPFPTELTDETGAYLQRVGREVGVTTGRIRRCGWLDLVIIRYTHRISNYSSLVLTKLDILDGLSEIKICTGYKLNGQEVTSYPADEESIKKVEVFYKVFPGWSKTPITNIRKWADLPDNAKKYVKFIQNELQIKVTWIGVGPGRNDMIQVP